MNGVLVLLYFIQICTLYRNQFKTHTNECIGRIQLCKNDVNSESDERTCTCITRILRPKPPSYSSAGAGGGGDADAGLMLRLRDLERSLAGEADLSSRPRERDLSSLFSSRPPRERLRDLAFLSPDLERSLRLSLDLERSLRLSRERERSLLPESRPPLARAYSSVMRRPKKSLPSRSYLASSASLAWLLCAV